MNYDLMTQTRISQFVVGRLKPAMINLHTKFEVSMLIHYEGMKGRAKCRN